MHGLVGAAALAGLLCFAGAAKALELTFQNSYGFENPHGLEFDPTDNSLWVSTNIADTSGNVFNVDPANGTVNSSFAAPDPVGSDPFTAGIAFRGPNLLLTNDEGSYLEVTKGGAQVGSAFTGPDEIEGMANDPVTGGLILTSSNDETILFTDLALSVGSMFKTDALDPAFNDPRGLTYDPLTENLLVVDNNNTIYEVSRSGVLLMQLPFADVLTGVLGIAEGVALDPASSILYVAFDGTNSDGGPSQIARFRYTGTFIPEPGTLALMLTGLAGIVLLRCRRPAIRADRHPL